MQNTGSEPTQPPKSRQAPSQGTEIPVRLRGFDGKTALGEVRLQTWDQRDRLVRAFKFWGTFWGMAMVALLIPGMHFFLVPALLTTGPILAWRTYQQERAILGGKGTCPDCGAPLLIAPTKDRWPLSDLCTKCYRSIKIEKL